MKSEDWKRLRGIQQLVHEGIDEGASFVERHHRRAIEKPFKVLGAIPELRQSSAVVHAAYGGVLSVTYGSLRTVNRMAARAGDWGLDRLEEKDQD